YTHHAIILHHYAFSPGLHAMLVRHPIANHIFYHQRTHAIHQVHSILHELGHIVLGHVGMRLEEVLEPEFRAELVRLGLYPAQGLCRMVEPTHSREEQEAETFVRCLQQRLVAARRVAQLTHRSSSIAELTRYTRGLGYHD
ncbi:MAG: hypothetical protein K8S97_00985, partial [Anaerolineae bacterium]|nr:hypothetical protein [Anaerolineae bacterium]